MPQDNLKDGSSEGKALFNAFGGIASGHTPAEVISAAMNLVLNVVRQTTAKRSEAEALLTEVFGRSMSAIMEHYDPTTGRRRSVIPFDQVVSVSHTKFETSFGRIGKNGRT